MGKKLGKPMVADRIKAARNPGKRSNGQPRSMVHEPSSAGRWIAGGPPRLEMLILSRSVPRMAFSLPTPPGMTGGPSRSM